MFGPSNEFNEGALLFLGNWGPGWIALFVVLSIVLSIATWFDLSPMSRLRRSTILALRIVTLTVAVLLLLEPALELRQVVRVPNHIAVLVDTSESQSLPTPDGDNRMARAADIVADVRQWAEDESDTHIVDYYQFDGTLTPIDGTSLTSGTTADGAQTDLLGALQAARDNYDAREFGGIVLISDGTDNATMGARVREGESLDGASREQIERLGGPIHTYATADTGEIRDLSIERVVHDDFAFVRNAVNIEVDLRALNMDEVTVPVTLNRNGQPLRVQEVTIGGDNPTQHVTFEFVPELLGKEIYSVHVPQQQGEAVAENNDAWFVLKIVRDKIRVLQVVGRPSWDVRFLRQLLKNNPNVDLISFFILRSNEDLQRAPQDEMALIPFPTDELFNEQLGSFDLVVFQNFTHVPYRMRHYLPNIRDYVQGGGGFLMVGGEQSFSSGGYAGTELEEILPVTLTRATARSTIIDETPFRPQLTAAGQRHPITRLEFERAANENLWASLPLMRGTNIVPGLRDNAIALAVHPSQRGGDGPMPVIAISDIDDGRSMAMTFDSSWLWNYGHVLDEGSSRPYTSFWNSAMRWLIRDPALNLVQVQIGEEVVQPGQAVGVSVRVFRPDYEPAGATPGILRVIRTDLDSLSDDSAEDVVQTLEFVTDDRGVATMDVVPELPGAYRIEATAEVETGNALTQDEIFLAVRRTQEIREVSPRPALLREVADAAGGEARMARDGWRVPEFSSARAESINRRRIVHLWSTPWVLLLIVLTLGIEWQLRRRWGRL